MTDVLPIFEDNAQGGFHGFFIQMIDVQIGQGSCPIKGFGHTRHFIQAQLAQFPHEGTNLLPQLFINFGYFAAHNLQFFVKVGIIDVQVQTTPPQCFRQLSHPVAGHNDVWAMGRVDGAYFWNGDLPIRKHLQ